MHLTYDKLARDLYGRPEIPVMTLQTMARRTLGTISNATPPKLSIKFSEPSEISFDVAAYSDGVPTPLYKDITGHKVLHTEECGIYMLMEPETDGDGVEEVKHVKGYSIEKELEHKSFFLAEGVYNFYTPEPVGKDSDSKEYKEYKNTIVARILEKAPGWHVRSVSPALIGKYSTIDEYDDYLLSFIYNTAPEKYRCVFVFDPYEMAIDIYNADEDRRTLGIYLDYDNLVTSLDVKELSDELATAIRAYGADGLSTIHVNPTGTEWQYNLDYFIENGDIPADTASRWRAWQASVFTEQEEYRGLVSLKASETARLELLRAELSDLNLEMDGIIDRQTTTIQQIALEITDDGRASQQEELDGINAERDTKQGEIDAKQEQVNASEQLVKTYNTRLDQVNRSLAFNTTKLLTVKDRDILQKFFIEKDITQEGFVATDVDMNVSGSLKKYDNLRFEVSGSDVSRVGVDINGKTIYAARGGSFKLGSVLSGNIIRATLDISTDGSYIMSVYGGDVVYDGARHESCVLTISNSYMSGLSSNVAESTEARDGIETRVWRGSWLRFNTGSNTTTYFTTSVTEYQSLSVEMELFDYAADVLDDLSTPTYEFSVDTGNFLFAQEFEPFRDQLELGCAIHLRISDDRVVTPILIGLDMDFGNLDKLSLTFSNRFKLHDSVNTLKDMLEMGYSAGRSLDTSKYIYGRTVEKTAQVSKFMSESLDVAKNAIVNAQNQSVVIDGAGIHVRGKDGNSQYQLRMINNMIAMTDDNWKHAKLAIGLFGAEGAGGVDDDGKPINQYWGVNADVIGGKLIVGNNLIIENVRKTDGGGEVMQFKVDASGAFLNNGTLCVQTDTNSGKILIDPRYGIIAGTKEIYTVSDDGSVSLKPAFIGSDGKISFDTDHMPNDVNFFLDVRDGKAYFRGNIYAENGYFNGEIHATSGEFNGTLKAATLDGKLIGTQNGEVDLSAVDYIDLGGMVLDGRAGSTGIRFKPGYEPVKYEFCTYAAAADSKDWHPVMTTNDKYRRDSLNGGTSWGAPYQFRGTDGDDGKDGVVDYSEVNRILKETYGITETYITQGKIGSPVIQGATIYGGKIYAGTGDANSNFAMMTGNGLEIYRAGIDKPKFKLYVKDPDKPGAESVILSMGSGDFSSGNQFHIVKGENLTRLIYKTTPQSGDNTEGDSWCGFTLWNNRTITVHGNLQVNAVWAD